MLYTLRELENKEVINLCSGKFLGHICDLEVESDCGKVTAVYICPAGGLWCSGKERTRIPWEKIRCIGVDTIIVEEREERPADCRSNKKAGWWAW